MESIYMNCLQNLLKEKKSMKLSGCSTRSTTERQKNYNSLFDGRAIALRTIVGKVWMGYTHLR